MSVNVTEVVEAVRHLTPAQQREALARLWPEQGGRDGGMMWMSVCFDDALRVIAYAPEQVLYVSAPSDFCNAARWRAESEADGTYEVYGPDRTYDVTMTPTRVRRFAQFVGDRAAPREVTLLDAQW